MSGVCPAIGEGAGAILGVLAAVDCNVRLFAEGGYRTLTAPDAAFQGWLGAALVIYVALLGWRLMLGGEGARFSDLTRTGLKVGCVLALTSQWPLFQTLVFDLAAKAPLEIAALASPAGYSPVAGVQAAYDQLSLGAQAYGKAAGPGAQAFAGGGAGAAEALWRSAQFLFLATAGAFSACMAMVGVLTAVGPVFIALGLFGVARGLFVGWLRALAAAALAPMAGWMAVSLMLRVVEPSLALLARERLSGRLDPDVAMSAAGAMFVFSGVLLALLAAGAAIGFGFNPWRGRIGTVMAPAPTVAPSSPAPPAVSRAEALAGALARTRGAAMRADLSVFAVGGGPVGTPSLPAAPPTASRGAGPRRAAIKPRGAFLTTGGA